MQSSPKSGIYPQSDGLLERPLATDVPTIAFAVGCPARGRGKAAQEHPVSRGHLTHAPNGRVDYAAAILDGDVLKRAIDLEAHQSIAIPVRQRIDALIAEGQTDYRLDGFDAVRLDESFFSLAAKYEMVTAPFSATGKPPRNAADVIAWIDMSSRAVFPIAKDGFNVLTDEQKSRALTFFHTAVFYDIALEEIGETLREANRHTLNAFVNGFAQRRIIHRERVVLESEPNFLALDDDEQAYVKMVDHSISLLDHSIEAMCDVEIRGEDHRQQLDQIQAAMDVDRENLLKMMDFGEQFDAFVRGQRKDLIGFFETPGGGSLSQCYQIPETKAFNNAAQLNIFLRYMILGNFKQLWANLSPEQRGQFEFEILLQQVVDMGQKIDSLGNLSNDLGTYWRECLQATAVNTVIVEALNDPDPEERLSKREFLEASEGLRSMGDDAAKELIGKIAQLHFAQEYESGSIALREEYGSLTVFDLMDKVLKKDGPFRRIMDMWNREYRALQDPEAISEIGKLYDIPALVEAQFQVLLRYAASAVRKMNI